MFTILKSTAMDGGLSVSRADQEDNRTCKHFLYINFVYRYDQPNFQNTFPTYLYQLVDSLYHGTQLLLGVLLRIGFNR